MLRVAQLHDNVGGQVLLTQISQLGIFPSCNHKSLLTAEICTPMDESRCFRHLQLSEVKNFLQSHSQLLQFLMSYQANHKDFCYQLDMGFTLISSLRYC